MSARAIGIDIGGTKIAAGIVDLESGEVSRSLVQPTDPGRGGQAVLDDCLAIAGNLLEWCAIDDPDRGCAGIGIGVPELVDRGGNVQSAFQFDWMSLPVRQAFSSLGTVVIESDVRAAALAEATFGAARGATSALYISVGTGISSCLLLDGIPWPGAHGNALVMGTGPTVVIDPITGQATSHVLEEIASGPALARRYRLVAGKAVTGAGEVLARANEGDLHAIVVVSSAAQALGNAIGHLVNVLDPGIVVVGGGLGHAAGQFWNATVSSIRSTIWSDISRQAPVAQGRLGTSAGLIGAALSLSANLKQGVPDGVRARGRVGR